MIKDIIAMIKLPFRKEKELYYDLKAIIGFYPNNIELYKLALMHKSIMHRNAKGKPVNNERLEFLGDAVLDAVVGDIVYRHFPGKREGFLTNTRSKLVQRETLGKLANEMGISRLILASSRSQSHNSYMGGNAFEALVGAMYLDRGYDTCMKFMEKQILKKLINIDKVAYKEVNFKSKLLEWSQKNRINLSYELMEEGKDENGSPVFSYKVLLENIECCKGKGFSKKEAQQQASKLTLEKLRGNSKLTDSIFAAKADRTKMEEQPVMVVPDIEQPNVEIETTEKKNEDVEREPLTTEENTPNNDSNTVEADEKPQHQRRQRNPRRKSDHTDNSDNVSTKVDNNDDDEFDLSDINVKKQSREDIIAAAEAAAFGE